MLHKIGKSVFKGIAMSLASLMLVMSVPYDGLYAFASEPEKADTEEVYFDEAVSDQTVSENDADETTEDVLSVSDNESSEEDSAEETVSDNQVSEEGLFVSGSYGNVTWSIDGKGTLTVSGTGNAYEVDEDGVGYAPWLDYMDNIYSAKVTLTGATSLYGFFSGLHKLKSVDLSGLDTSTVTNMSYMFGDAKILQENLKTLDLSNLKTGNVTKMTGMFAGLQGIKTLDLSGFDTSKVTDMTEMFMWCEGLESVNLSSFDTSNVTGMSGMFDDCIRLKSLDLSGFNTKNVGGDSFMGGGMSNMFKDCKALKNLDLSSFDTSNVASMSGMFSGCESLTGLNLINFNTSKVTNMSFMFSGCTNLKQLDISNFDTTAIKPQVLKMGTIEYPYSLGMGYMFQNCKSLAELNMSSFDLSSLEAGEYTSLQKAFAAILENCDTLSMIKTPKNTNIDIDLPGSGWKRTDSNSSVTQIPKGLNESIDLMLFGPVKSLLIDCPKDFTMAKGDEATLVAVVIPYQGDITGMSWKSDNEDVATVVADEVSKTAANVRAVGKGTANITVSVGKVSASVTVTVSEPIAFDVNEFTLVSKENSARQINVTLSAQGYSVDELIWTSTNESVATVDNKGLVKAVPNLEDEGVTVIKAETPDGKYRATCTVKVTVPAKTQAPTASVKPGEVEKGTKVLLSSATYGATIFYTDDGSPLEFDDNGKVYSTTKIYDDAIIIDKDVEIKAIAVCDGYKASSTKIFKYTVSQNWGDISAADQKALFAGDVSKVPEGIWYLIDGKVYTKDGATDIEKIYNANKITFNDEIRVYHSTRRLWENRDYTIDYKNNTNVASKDAGAKAP
ncbi:MAG: BspA family leucine-rich repeat surface protein, partial [Lachnospiraceae bacterium]|nr:BspA family leucine-rich repeat surface protein [Lachnospiraceae bacterium]